MVFAGLVALIGFASGYIQGGRILRIRWAGLGHLTLLLGALAVQIWAAVFTMAGLLPQPVSIVALVGAQTAVIVWMLHHLDRPGMLLLIAGLTANTMVIALNGGMPVSPEALAIIGATTTEISTNYYHTMTEATRLTLLADIIPVPPLRSVISPGDVLVALGLIPFLGHLMASPGPGHAPVKRRHLGPIIDGRSSTQKSPEPQPRAA